MFVFYIISVLFFFFLVLEKKNHQVHITSHCMMSRLRRDLSLCFVSSFLPIFICFSIGSHILHVLLPICHPLKRLKESDDSFVKFLADSRLTFISVNCSKLSFSVSCHHRRSRVWDLFIWGGGGGGSSCPKMFLYRQPQNAPTFLNVSRAVGVMIFGEGVDTHFWTILVRIPNNCLKTPGLNLFAQGGLLPDLFFSIDNYCQLNISYRPTWVMWVGVMKP